eukprot:1158881-Pelagomonas_calceolata.AAC.7
MRSGLGSTARWPVEGVQTGKGHVDGSVTPGVLVSFIDVGSCCWDRDSHRAFFSNAHPLLVPMSCATCQPRGEVLSQDLPIELPYKVQKAIPAKTLREKGSVGILAGETSLIEMGTYEGLKGIKGTKDTYEGLKGMKDTNEGLKGFKGMEDTYEGLKGMKDTHEGYEGYGGHIL